MFQNLPSILPYIVPKTFVIDSCDDMIATILKQNGWKQINKNSNSWNLKWTWKTDNKQIENLQNGQYINHFIGSDQITTKLGMSLLLKRNPIIMDSGKSFSSYFPRSYNLSSDKEEFIKDFINTGILNLLKKIKVCIQVFYEKQYIQAIQIMKSVKNKSTGAILQKILEQEKLFDYGEKTNQKLQLNGKLFANMLFYLQNLFSLDEIYHFSEDQLYELNEYSKQEIPFRSHIAKNKANPSLESIALILLYHDKCLKQINHFYQDGFSNIWIVKSNHSSRGRNISILDDLKNIYQLDNGMKLVQKYIQNIWILHDADDRILTKYPQIGKILNKKFDIRFWVLVKSFNPLSYLRISSQSYRLDALDTKHSHLTNYSVNWKNKKNTNSDISYLLLSDFLQFLEGQNIANSRQILDKIYNITLQTLKCVQIKQNQSCFELFGLDVILDANLNPWILECNMSPACNPRGELKNILKNMNQGLLSILGFISKSTNGWKLLSNQRKIQNRVLKPLKQVKTDSNRSFKPNMTLVNFNQLFIGVNKLSWKKYKYLQQIHYFIQKLKKIQSICRIQYKIQFNNLKKKNNQQRFSEPKVRFGKALKIIQVLAKLSKKTKSKWFVFISLSLKRLYATKQSRLRQIRCLNS